MTTLRILSRANGWAVTVSVPICHGVGAHLARQLKELGCTGTLLPGGLVEIDADRSRVKMPIDIASIGK